MMQVMQKKHISDENAVFSNTTLQYLSVTCPQGRYSGSSVLNHC